MASFDAFRELFEASYGENELKLVNMIGLATRSLAAFEDLTRELRGETTSAGKPDRNVGRTRYVTLVKLDGKDSQTVVTSGAMQTQ